ncbi:hypothetical protein H5410_030316 [Solanum commersonii]|uniref:Uncharacterized protein n=1 Tax=Solanum commersonii TaxID=4109 RepID=A0A9J5YFD0_SOLCO|nr:hypothetical protein H5410_030316 [Solanum commersonii]
MGRRIPRPVEKGVLGQNTSVSLSGLLNITPSPVYYQSEDEFKDPLEVIEPGSVYEVLIPLFRTSAS